jgi:hypothetical protein
LVLFNGDSFLGVRSEQSFVDQSELTFLFFRHTFSRSQRRCEIL